MRGDDLRLGTCHLLQPAVDLVLGARLQGQIAEEFPVATLRVGQIQVKRTQVNQGLVFEKRLGQKPEPLAGARLHERGHQKQVSQRADASPVPETPFTKRADIAVGSGLGEDSPPLLDEIQDLAEVPHLLVGE